MKRKRIGDTQCPIARGLERVGEWWSILILRDALHGFTRFDQFQESLGIAPNMLTRRLTSLVKSGLLERRLYNQRPPRYEYVLTERGRRLLPFLDALRRLGQSLDCNECEDRKERLGDYCEACPLRPHAPVEPPTRRPRARDRADDSIVLL